MTLFKRFTLAALLFSGVGANSSSWAAEFCADDYYIDATLPNQARWDMCWEHRSREGIVLHHIHYTPRNGTRRMVLYQAAMAQIHVPYDDNGARYHDVSDYGLGGNYMRDLAVEECPNGQRITYQGKNVICRQIQARGDAYSTDTDHLQGDALNLFSVSAIGAYNYIPQWRFLDNGAIEPGIGATGALQRFASGSGEQNGWLLESNKVGIAHLHNFFWKLDFDLGGTAGDDAVEEINYIQSNGQTRRTLTRLETEAARSVDPNQLRSWRVLDTVLKNSKGLPLSYEIRLNHAEQKDVGPATEPFTHYDFYATRQKACELFASHNPTTGGCATDLSQFVDGENIDGQDIVVWPAVTFYHMPRAEDAPRMDAHWTYFQIIPRDWHDKNPLSDSEETSTGSPPPPPPPPPTDETISNDGSHLATDGNLDDWSSLRSFGSDPDDISGANNPLNWLEGWAANDADSFHLAYHTKDAVTAGSWGYQIYLDTDESTNTGFRTGAIGADYLFEGQDLWRYAGDGSSWSWTYQGRANQGINGNTAEFSFPLGWLGNTNQLRLFFWGNNTALGGDAKDSYPDGAVTAGAALRYFTYKMHASEPGNGNNGTSNPVNNLSIDGNLADWNELAAFGADPADVSGVNNTIDLLEGWMAHNTSNVYLAYRTAEPINTSVWWAYQTYLDTDENATTGYAVADTLGAEYLVEGPYLWRYTGDGSSWEWSLKGALDIKANGTAAEGSFPRGWLDNPAALRLLFHANNRAAGGDAEDWYPDANASPRYFRYHF